MSNNQETVIGPGTHVAGDLSFEKSAKIIGDFEGSISGEGTCHITENAVCRAQINAGKVVVDGEVEGNVSATERVELNAKGAIRGDVYSPKMVIADGASLDGNLNIGSGAAAAAAGAAKVTSTSTGALAGAASKPAAPPRPRKQAAPAAAGADSDDELDQILSLSPFNE